MFLYVFALILVFSVGAQNNFTPGCSFYNGQCIYNVKLGHEQHCDVSTRELNNQQSSSSGTGGTSSVFQACSCKDIDNLNKNMASLWSQLTQLQTDMTTIAQRLNVSNDQLARKDWEIVDLLSKTNNLTALLADKDKLLNRSQIDLANTVQQMGAEITRLRNELANSKKDLSICQTTLNLTSSSSKTVIFGNYETYQFDFEDSTYSNFTLSTCSTSSEECWLRGSGRQNTLSGPQEDHTFGAPQGHYMYIDPYNNPPYGSSRCDSYSHASRSAMMTSPEFPPASEYCVRFWYTLYGSNVENFKVYAKTIRHWNAPPDDLIASAEAVEECIAKFASTRERWGLISPNSSLLVIGYLYGVSPEIVLILSDKQMEQKQAQVGGGNGYPVMSKSGQEDKYWHMAQISLSSEYTATPFRLVFEASTRSYYYNDYNTHITKHVCNGYGYIAFDDVYVYNTSCNAIISCPPGSYKMADGNKTSCYTFHIQPASWYDAIKICKSETLNSHLVSVNSVQEQTFLVNTIQHDTGLSTAGNMGWYTSGNDELDEGNFVWADTGYPYPLNYTNWHPGQPNNVGSVQDCLLMEYAADNYEWGDVNCHDKHPFICEAHE